MSKKTMEELCITRTTGDLWHTLNDTTNLTYAILHNLHSDANYVVRFLGPFVKAKRVYTGCFSPIINKIDIKGIIDGNSVAYQGAIKVINECYPEDARSSGQSINRRRERNDPLGLGSRSELLDDFNAFHNPYNNPNSLPVSKNGLEEAQKQLSILYGKLKYWQKCIMVNALCEPFTSPLPGAPQQNHRNDLDVFINVFVLTATICDKINIASVPYANENCRINGLVAHSMHISKQGRGLQSKYNVSMLPESTLSPLYINKIIAEGLYDIPVVAKACNRKKTPFIYKVEQDYRMPVSLLADIAEECKKFEESKHFDRTEEQIHEVPREAFENGNIMVGGIDSLEV